MLKSHFFIISFTVLIYLVILNTGCKSDNNKIEKFRWEEGKCAVPGYPIEVYRGGFKRPNGNFTSLYGGLTTRELGDWGGIGNGMSDGIKSLPNGLHVKWVSYAENCVYEIDTPIDYDKILALFKKGYYEPLRNPERPPFKAEYNHIGVGFAPGGVVIIWIEGAARQIEIGRYQGYKIQVSQEEIAQLDAPDQLMFNTERRQSIMKDIRVVPQEIQKAHKGKPIPYGRWDNLRKRYRWKIHLELPKHLKDKKAALFYYNGERENLFGKVHTEKFSVENFLKLEALQERAVPEVISLRWFDSEDNLKVGNIKFNEQEIFKAFEKVFKDTLEGEAQLEIRVNQIETNASIKLVGNGNEVWLSKTKVKVFD